MPRAVRARGVFASAFLSAFVFAVAFAFASAFAFVGAPLTAPSDDLDVKSKPRTTADRTPQIKSPLFFAVARV